MITVTNQRVARILVVAFLFSAQVAAAQRLTEQEWIAVDASIERAVDWIASTQERDGSFPSHPSGQPAVTSFGVLAMLAQGEMPEGERGGQLTRAIDFTINQQKPSGLLAAVGPRGATLSRNVQHAIGQRASYNHAISGLMLTEAYATTNSEQSQRMQTAIERALKVTLEMQRWPTRRAIDRGGWRYLDRFSDGCDSDLSAIGWHLMFLRSAKNAGFDVPAQAIDEAVGCIRRHYSPEAGKFQYVAARREYTRAMTGAGILALAHAGLHETEEARQAGQSMLGFSFSQYNANLYRGLDRYHYSLFQCTQAAYQLGDDYWEQFCPSVFRTVLANQNQDGSWDEESTNHGDRMFGRVYTTSLVVLSLSAPNQFLPIFQR